jgi:uncharacterized protein (DUF1778 family)
MMSTIEKARFDTRLSKQQKDFFEYAANLGGYRTLTEFFIASAQERANKIIEEHNRVITSMNDQEVFFNQLINPSEPNENLKSAASRYKGLVKS